MPSPARDRVSCQQRGLTKKPQKRLYKYVNKKIRRQITAYGALPAQDKSDRHRNQQQGIQRENRAPLPGIEHHCQQNDVQANKSRSCTKTLDKNEHPQEVHAQTGLNPCPQMPEQQQNDHHPKPEVGLNRVQKTPIVQPEKRKSEERQPNRPSGPAPRFA